MCMSAVHIAGMDPEASYEPDAVDGHVHLKPGTGGSFSPPSALRPGRHSPYLPLDSWRLHQAEKLYLLSTRPAELF